jgi:hypothetical protein
MQKLFSVRRRGIRVFAALGLLSALMAASIPAGAQESRIKADIPFDFIVRGETLPAGEYTVRRTSTPGLLIIQELSGRHNLSVLAQHAQRSSGWQKPGLVFNRYGDSYFLSQVLSEGYSSHTLSRSRRERALAAADHLARNAVRPETVLVTTAMAGFDIAVAIPFGFVVGGQLLPPGNYMVRHNPSEGRQALAIRSADGRTVEMFSTTAVQRRLPLAMKLVFDRYGDRHFLSQVWAEGSSGGYELTESRAARRLAMDARRSKDAHQLQRVTLPLP